MSEKRRHAVKPGFNVEFDFTTHTGACQNIQVNALRDLPRDRLILALKRLKRIVKETKLTGDDCTLVGCKHTECSWGLCNDTVRMWPDAQDHIFPYDFLNEGRISSLHHRAGECPMDKRALLNKYGKPNKSIQGCFFSCRFFQGPKPTREKALMLIEAKIGALEEEQRKEDEPA